jgi:hypothetical protein
VQVDFHGGFSMIQRQQRQVLVESRPKPWDVHRYVLANFHKAGPLAIKRLSSSCAKIVIESQPDVFFKILVCSCRDGLAFLCGPPSMEGFLYPKVNASLWFVSPLH